MRTAVQATETARPADPAELWRAIRTWLKQNTKQAIVSAAIGAVVGYAVNFYLMLVTYDGYVVHGGWATSKGNLLSGALIWALGSTVVFSLIGYRRAVGKERFWREVKNLPETLQALFTRDGASARIHLLWGAAASFLAMQFVSPWLGAVIAVGLLSSFPSFLGQMLANLLLRVWSALVQSFAPTRGLTLQGPMTMMVGMMGACAALVLGFFIAGSAIKLLLALGCGGAAWMLGKQNAPSKTCLLLVLFAAALLGQMLYDFLHPFIVAADDGGLSENQGSLVAWWNSGQAGPVFRWPAAGAASAAAGSAVGSAIGGLVGGGPGTGGGEPRIVDPWTGKPLTQWEPGRYPPGEDGNPGEPGQVRWGGNWISADEARERIAAAQRMDEQRASESRQFGDESERLSQQATRDRANQLQREADAEAARQAEADAKEREAINQRKRDELSDIIKTLAGMEDIDKRNQLIGIVKNASGVDDKGIPRGDLDRIRTMVDKQMHPDQPLSVLGEALEQTKDFVKGVGQDLHDLGAAGADLVKGAAEDIKDLATDPEFAKDFWDGTHDTVTKGAKAIDKGIDSAVRFGKDFARDVKDLATDQEFSNDFWDSADQNLGKATDKIKKVGDEAVQVGKDVWNDPSILGDTLGGTLDDLQDPKKVEEAIRKGVPGGGKLLDAMDKNRPVTDRLRDGLLGAAEWAGAADGVADAADLIKGGTKLLGDLGSGLADNLAGKGIKQADDLIDNAAAAGSRFGKGAAEDAGSVAGRSTKGAVDEAAPGSSGIGKAAAEDAGTGAGLGGKKAAEDAGSVAGRSTKGAVDEAAPGSSGINKAAAEDAGTAAGRAGKEAGEKADDILKAGDEAGKGGSRVRQPGTSESPTPPPRGATERGTHVRNILRDEGYREGLVNKVDFEPTHASGNKNVLGSTRGRGQDAEAAIHEGAFDQGPTSLRSTTKHEVDHVLQHGQLETQAAPHGPKADWVDDQGKWTPKGREMAEMEVRMQELDRNLVTRDNAIRRAGGNPADRSTWPQEALDADREVAGARKWLADHDVGKKAGPGPANVEPAGDDLYKVDQTKGPAPAQSGVDRGKEFEKNIPDVNPNDPNEKWENLNTTLKGKHDPATEAPDFQGGRPLDGLQHTSVGGFQASEMTVIDKRVIGADGNVKAFASVADGNENYLMGKFRTLMNATEPEDVMKPKLAERQKMLEFVGYKEAPGEFMEKSELWVPKGQENMARQALERRLAADPDLANFADYRDHMKQKYGLTNEQIAKNLVDKIKGQ